MRNLKKLPASLLLIIAFALPTFGGVIECPVTGAPPPDSPAMFQPGPTLEAAPEEPEGFTPEDDKSLFEVTLDLLRGVALTLF